MPTDSSAQSNQPNILMFVTDDQPRQWFNVSGAGRGPDGRGASLTPTLDALAARGTVLDGLYTPSPLCVPSRFAYLTGCYPSRAENEWFRELHRLHNHPFIHQESKITPDKPTLAARLKALGYRTGAVGKNHAFEVPGWRMLPQDADPADPAVRTVLEENRERVRAAYRAGGFDVADRIYHTNPSVYPRAIGVHNMEWLVEGACQFLESSVDDSVPFFLYFASTLPHGPREGWKHDPLATPDGRLEAPPKTTMPSRDTLVPRLAAAGYDEAENRADLLWLDDGLGAILRKIEEMGCLDHTVIYFGTDHGIDAKASVYEPGVHITGLFAGPGVRAGATSVAPCVIPDVAATLLDLAGGDPAGCGMDGRSLAPVLTGERDRVRDSIYLEFGHARVVIEEGWKYIALRYSDYTRTLPMEERLAWLEAAEDYLRRCHEPFTFKTNDPKGPFGVSGFIPDGWTHERLAMRSYPHYFDADQLYHLPTDPGERTNLADRPEHAARLARMRKLLAEHLRDLPGGFAEFKPPIYSEISPAERMAIGRSLMPVVFH